MKIVIDIEEGRYNWIMSHASNDPGDYANSGDLFFRKAVESGTVLPKGHGKIIAEPTEEDITKTVGGQNDFAECIKDAVKAVFDNAPTIIEADKETENA